MHSRLVVAGSRDSVNRMLKVVGTDRSCMGKVGKSESCSNPIGDMYVQSRMAGAGRQAAK